ncbi:hypothetical protein Tco_0900116 [Tanacetum coccineum]
MESLVSTLRRNTLKDHGFVGYPFDYCATLGFGSIAGGLDPVNPVIRLPIERRINSGTRVGAMAGVDINTLIMEQYLSLSRENQASGVGPIPGMTPTQALTAIQTIADHSQKWHDGTLSRRLSSISNTNGLAAIDVKSAKDLTSTKNFLSMRKSNRWRRPNIGNLAAQLRSTEVMEQNTVATNEIPSSSTRQCKVVNDDLEIQCRPISSGKLTNKEGWTTKDLQYQLPPKKLNPGNFTLPCTISNFNFYGMADLALVLAPKQQTTGEFLQTLLSQISNSLIIMENSKKRFSTGNDGIDLEYTFTVMLLRFKLLKKKGSAFNILHSFLPSSTNIPVKEVLVVLLMIWTINWQIAMIAIRMKKFYKKTGRRVRVDGKNTVGFEKKLAMLSNCHHQLVTLLRDMYSKGGTHDEDEERLLYQHQEAGKRESIRWVLLTMDDGIVNWGEHIGRLKR